jgi:hypothetical protein
MSFKNNLSNIPLSMINQYKTNNHFHQVGMVRQPLVDSNSFIDRQKLDLQMRKGFTQPDLTVYSQGNVGGKKN